MPPETKPTDLLDPDFLRRLERLQLFSKRIFRGQMRGERRSQRKGVSIEFADYRDYVRGDDLRFIDWNIYGRLDRLFLKLFLEEQDLCFYVLLDVSRSMDWGEKNKLDYAKKAAAALAYIGLSSMDKVGLIGFSADGQEVFSPKRGRGHIWRMFEFLNELKPTGQTSLHTFCREFAMKYRQRGIVVLISDLLDPAGYDEALKFLLHGNNDVYVIHVLADEELEPTVAGHLDLVDAETEDHTEITASPQMLQVYRRTVNAYCAQLKQYAGRYGMNYLLTATSTDFEQLILTVLRTRGLVK
jgi:uncharacterized protein (DUF58 family)